MKNLQIGFRNFPAYLEGLTGPHGRKMGDLSTSFLFFNLIWSSDLPRRSSWSLRNLSFACRCLGC